MKSKATDAGREETADVFEATVRGSGRVVIRHLDRGGRTLVTDDLSFSGGSPGIEAGLQLPLQVQVKGRAVPVVPVLAFQSDPSQEVLFCGRSASQFTALRAKVVGLPSKAIAAAVTMQEDPKPVRAGAVARADA